MSNLDTYLDDLSVALADHARANVSQTREIYRAVKALIDILEASGNGHLLNRLEWNQLVALHRASVMGRM